MTPCPKTSLPTGTKLARGNPTRLRLLELIAEFFCLRPKDAAELLRNRGITESDARSVRRTLSILHRDGFLCRLNLGCGCGGANYVYGLSDMVLPKILLLASCSQER
jgi:hypothetical protein